MAPRGVSREWSLARPPKHVKNEIADLQARFDFSEHEREENVGCRRGLIKLCRHGGHWLACACRHLGNAVEVALIFAKSVKLKC